MAEGAATPAALQVVDAADIPAVALLNELGIESVTYAHSVANTVEEQAAHVVGIEVQTLF